MRYPNERSFAQHNQGPKAWSNMSREACQQMLSQLCQQWGPRAVFEMCLDVCEEMGWRPDWSMRGEWSSQPWQQSQWSSQPWQQNQWSSQPWQQNSQWMQWPSWMSRLPSMMQAMWQWQQNWQMQGPRAWQEAASQMPWERSNWQGSAWEKAPWDMPEVWKSRGPKNWKRSDERICDDCCDAIERLGVDASDITVRVEKGECYLEGTCQTRKDRHLAEYVCEEVRGVVHVHNRLQVHADEVHLANGKVSVTDKRKESVIS